MVSRGGVCGRSVSTFLSVTFVLLAISAAQARTLTLEERIAAQTAIEQVYWSHRVWPKENPGPKPPLSEVMPASAIRAKVIDYLQQSNALDSIWQHAVTPVVLQAELDRMASGSKDPAMLSELYAALGNDPFVIAETLGRQTLVDRLIHDWYASDTRFHGGVKASADRALDHCSSLDCAKTLGGQLSETTWTMRGVEPISAIVLDPDEWTDKLSRLGESFHAEPSRLPVGHFTALEETPGGFVVTAVRSQSKDELITVSVVWPKRSFDAWWSEAKASISPELTAAPATYTLAATSSGPCVNDTWAKTVDEPSARSGHAAIWTGSEMIIWGGSDSNVRNDGSRYNPATDSWTPTSTGANVPAAGVLPVVVWSGTEMIVWGTSGNTGGRYNPSTNSWLPTSTGVNVPSARGAATGVWTGTRMIVWGGFGGSYQNTGGLYDPSTDTWAPTSTGANVPSARASAVSVWTGTRMIVYGGQAGFGFNGGGALYDPSTNSWSTMTAPVPTLLAAPNGPPVWSGTEMIIWGGSGSRGGRYNPASNSWTPTSEGANVPTGRSGFSAVWTGSEMIVWGGTAGPYLTTGGRYNPSTDSWLATSTGANVPAGRGGHTAVWTGSEMIVWGGTNGTVMSTGGRYNPSSDTWLPTQFKAGAPPSRAGVGAVWTGTEMLIWNGSNDSTPGSRYNPATDNWMSMATAANLPSTPAIWTGRRMIVWGGGSSVATGGLYDPATNSWTTTSTGANTPSIRTGHSLVWTGTEMIVWGGGNSNGPTNTGGRYNPLSNSWLPTSTTNAPLGVAGHAGVWTGSQMIVWGGTRAGFYLNSGGRYDPATDSWTATSTGLNVPPGRMRSADVWTGSSMLVWGGYNGNYLNTGGVYSPATDSWLPTSTGANVPAGRDQFSGVWTGAELIVWGGYSGSVLLNAGGRYNPSTDSWSPTSVGDNVPDARQSHAAVWTGSQMIVWGGQVTPTYPGIYCACPSGLIVYRDADGDGYGNAAISLPACDGTVPAGYVTNTLDCNDANNGVHPGMTETCNGVDDDCDGAIDNGGASLCNDSNVCTTDTCNGAGGCGHTFNTAPCDDGALCTNNDTCSGGVCAGTPGPPPEIPVVGMSGHATTTVSWSGLGGGTTYDLVSSTLSDLRVQAAAGATCLANDVAATSYGDTRSNPSSGDGYYYLIRAQNVCGNGGYGFDSSATERVPAAGCP